MKIQRVVTTLLLSSVLGNGLALADEMRGLVSGGYAAGDADFTEGGSSVDADLSGYALVGRLYPVKGMYLTAGLVREELEFDGLRIEGDSHFVGGGLVLGGRVDYRTGVGFEHRFGFELADTEWSVPGEVDTSSESDQATYVTYAVEAGIGHGFIGGLAYSTEAEEMFDANTFTVSLSRALGAGFFAGAEYNFSEYTPDEDSTIEGHDIAFALGLAF